MCLGRVLHILGTLVQRTNHVGSSTNAGNTYGYTSFSIASIVRADLAMLAKPGEVAAARRALTLVSHPGTIDATASSNSVNYAVSGLRFAAPNAEESTTAVTFAQQ